MYVSKVQIDNFRNFKSNTIDFKEGINVIIGHNNAGKSNLIKALALVIDNNEQKRLAIDDFNKTTNLAQLKSEPPKISIAITISKGIVESPDDLVTVSNWLTKLDTSYEALLTYEYFLPEKELSAYKYELEQIQDDDPKAMDKAWKAINHNFIRLYTYKIWGV